MAGSVVLIASGVGAPEGAALLAWRFVQHDRQFMIAMVKGNRSGGLPTGAGLAQELVDFEEHWGAGRPALLHSLTTCSAGVT